MEEPKPKKKARKSLKKTGLRRKSVVRIKARRPLKRRVSVAKKKKSDSQLILERFEHNPVIEPAQAHWESKATFNPSAVYGDGKVHVIYRAIGDDDVSVFGYASSKDALHFDTRSQSPAFSQARVARDTDFHGPLQYLSGGGWNGGSEDPRLTLMDDRVYMLYTSFDGWNAVRIALTSISFDDFINQRWNWKTPVFISPPGEIHKNWVLFPEKINGKYAILHGISPRISIDYFDSLDEFDGTKYINSTGPNGSGYSGSWDNWLRGAGPAPIKTKHGWLVFYHAMDTRDPNRYKIGAMLLDMNDPSKILVRSHRPILEPEEQYENEGHKSGVVYSCGAVDKDGWLFVYYGGADKVVCVATAKLDEFLKELISSSGASKKAKLSLSK